MRGTSQKIHIVAFQTFVMLMQRKDFTIFLHQSQRQAGNVYFRINICLAFGEDAVFQPHVVQYAGKRLYVGHFNLYTFPAGGGKTVAAMDCLVPGIGEIIGGSQREDSYEKLVARMHELGLKEEDYQFYLDLRKYGSARHSGFGLGFERCVMYLTGMSNIRDVVPFPRTVNNCEL